MNMLLSHGADLTKVTQGGWSPLHIAAHKGHTEALRLCYEHAQIRGFVSAPTDNGWTILHYAAFSGSLDTVKLAIQKKPSAAVINSTCCMGYSPLHVAVSKRSKEVVQALLDDGADVNLQSNDGCTALHLAQEDNADEIGKLLLDNNADPNVASKKDGLTPLHRAAILNHIGFVEVLLNCGRIDVKRVSKMSRKTASEYARDHNNLQILNKLRQKERWRNFV